MSLWKFLFLLILNLVISIFTVFKDNVNVFVISRSITLSNFSSCSLIPSQNLITNMEFTHCIFVFLVILIFLSNGNLFSFSSNPFDYFLPLGLEGFDIIINQHNGFVDHTIIDINWHNWMSLKVKIKGSVTSRG